MRLEIGVDPSVMTLAPQPRPTIPVCPACNGTAALRHCGPRACVWWICKRCDLVFDKGGRTFSLK